MCGRKATLWTETLESELQIFVGAISEEFAAELRALYYMLSKNK